MATITRKKVYISQSLPQMGLIFAATTIDWIAATLEVRRAFKPTRRCAPQDISGVGIAINGVKGKRTRYYATVDFELAGERIEVARTAAIRRKAESACEQGMALVAPLAEALHVPIVERTP